MSMHKVYVVAVGMTKFVKPGEDDDYPAMVKESVTKCLSDAGIKYNSIQKAYAGYVYGESTCGQRSLYELGMTGIPIINVNNNCSTGSTALYLAYNAIKGGLNDCVLALGFEKMSKGPLDSKFDDRANPIEKHVDVLSEIQGVEPVPIVPQLFGAAGLEHMKKYGTTAEHFAKIALKNHNNSLKNPYSQSKKKYTLKEIMESKMVYDPLTKLQCCPTSNGSAAAIVASESFVKAHHLESQSVEIIGMEMVTDFQSTFKDQSCIKMVGYDMTKTATDRLFSNTNLKRTDVDVVELHDCFSSNELITYEALGLCEIGKAAEFIDSGNNTYGGKYVVNPSGGLLAKGHPLGATGLAQCAELCWQLRGMAEERQVPNAKLALQHNIGLGGAVVVTLYSKTRSDRMKPQSQNIDGKGFKVEPVFKLIGEQLKNEGAKYVKKMKGVFCFEVTNGPNGKTSYWTVDAKNGTGSVKNTEEKGDVKITIKDSDLFDLMLGKLSPVKAFFDKKLRIKGKMGLALKLKELKPADLKARL